MTDKKKKRFNVIDFVIVVVVLGCIAGIAARYNIVNRIVVDSDRDEVEISFLATDMSPMLSYAVNVGETFYSEASGISMGPLIEYDVKDSIITFINDSGEKETAADPAKKDITGTLRATGIMSADGFMLGGTQYLAAGKTLTIQSLEVQLSVIITEIKHING